jgi:hypothetical protein
VFQKIKQEKSKTQKVLLNETNKYWTNYRKSMDKHAKRIICKLMPKIDSLSNFQIQ